jgi:cyclopropane-fatty-acyl-phospholipid synthase
MTNLTAPLARTTHPLGKTRFLNHWAKSLLHRQLAQLQVGEILLHDGTSHRFGKTEPGFPLSVEIWVDKNDFYSETVFGGSIGAAEAYMADCWHCSNLVDLVRILILNKSVLDGMDGGFSWATAHIRKLLHEFHRNTRLGSRRNITAHYDLGNDFFRLFLDDTMMYSCAYFERPDANLYDASVAKLDLICRTLQLSPQDHVIEIGSGWGGFALHAARHYGCRVTATTISKYQFDFAQARIQQAGLTDRITLLLEDYRDLSGTYDKLVSIEMVEAVGHQYYDTYFAKCAALLKPDGLALIQAITIADQQFKRARDEVDFIKRHVFPGSCIPSITALLESTTRASDLTLIHLEDIGPHYATTLRLWRESFLANLDAVRRQGYSEAFIKMWEFYLAYCEGGYVERAIGDAQLLLAKPLYRAGVVI